MRSFFTNVVVLAVLLIVSSQVRVNAIESRENSDPYLVLAVDRTEVRPGETLSFSLEFANRGRDKAEDVTITLNQPLDGRSPLLFVSADPPPDRWISSEYGNLPEFVVPVIGREATESGKISLVARVREAVSTQELQVSAGLLAPRREIGRQQASSNSVTVRIYAPESQEASPPSVISDDSRSSAFASPAAQPKEIPEAPPTVIARLFSSEALWSTLLFLAATAMIVLSFVAGRKSRRL